MPDNINYPKILSNIPEGKDLFKAESHKKIANTIIEIIENQANLIDKQIIGLEGDWGTGKSNIIKIIEENSKEKYFHFTYDTWTHQEDLTRKSIIIELINSLRNKIESFKNEEWIDKENKLSQKKISKNVKTFPELKLYYIFLIIGFIIIKFINEIKKQTINGKIYGYYDDSLSYLKKELYFNIANSINTTYFFKLIPYLFFITSFILFSYSFYKEFKQNEKLDKNDKSKLTFWGLVGKSFYWISGEKLETNSDETITESEPSNLVFRNFLKDIDNELIKSEITLILTIDNTDRLSDIKLQNIWATINIFFAESNNDDFLKNIWLIIPYDSKKVIKSFNDEIGVGLLEKTFALTFKVPPPLISNWELFFRFCFNKSFNDVKIESKKAEIEILLRIYENFEKDLTPRKIVNFINQLATYYIQNSQITLRYYAIVILKKDILFQGAINETIINRSTYLGKLGSLFTDDFKLELYLAKIIYGVEKDEDAEEALLHDEIDNILVNDKSFDEKLLNTPYFNSYFFKYFKKFLDKEQRSGLINDTYFDKVTRILVSLNDSYINQDNEKAYISLWQYYYNEVRQNKFLTFNETHKAICLYCTKKSKVEFINTSLKNILGDHPFDAVGFPKENQLLYIDFLKQFDLFTSTNSQILFKDIEISEQTILSELAIELISDNKDLYKKFKFKIESNNLKNLLTTEPFGDVLDKSILSRYRHEILYLNDQQELGFIEEEINKNWLNRNLLSIEEVETLIFYFENYKNIKIDNLSNKTFASIIDLINQSHGINLTNAFCLVLINYEKNKASNISTEISNALLKLDNKTLQLIIGSFEKFSNYAQLINILEFSIEFKSIHQLGEFSNYLITKNILNLGNDEYNWLLKHYTIINAAIFPAEQNKFYEFLNRNAKNHIIDIENIDPLLINSTRKFLNTELIKKSNDYLKKYITDNNNFLQKIDTNEYSLFIKLLNFDKIEIEILNEYMLEPYLYLVLYSNISIRNTPSDLKKIKSFINNDALKSKIEENLSRLINKSNVYLLSPEIFSFFDRVQTLYRNKTLQILIEKPEYYNIDLIDQITISGNALSNSLIRKLDLIEDNEIRKYMMEKGIIPNPN